MTTIKELRNMCGLSRKEFCSEYYNIPLRTLEDWEGGRRTPAPYYVHLLARCVEEWMVKNRDLHPLSEKDALDKLSKLNLECSFSELLTDVHGFFYVRDEEGFLHCVDDIK